MHCDHNCDRCSGCGVRDLTLTEEEITVLHYFEEIPFLPVARKRDSEEPIFLEDSNFSTELYSSILLCLEKKRLISLDYDKPISGWDVKKYSAYPIVGSMALTQRGQNVLDVLSVLGLS